jgi:hypothetical protein
MTKITQRQTRGRGRPKGTGRQGDVAVLREIAGLLLGNPTLKPTTAIRRVTVTDDPSTIRRFQVKWKKDGAVFLEEARKMEIERYDPVRHANAPKGTLVSVDPTNSDHWDQVGISGWNQVCGVSNGRQIMRRDFPQGFITLEQLLAQATEYLRQAGI